MSFRKFSNSKWVKLLGIHTNVSAPGNILERRPRNHYNHKIEDPIRGSTESVRRRSNTKAHDLSGLYEAWVRTVWE